MQIAVFGINHKQADVALREVIAKACQNAFLSNWQAEPIGVVLLSTCNRTEVYFSAELASYDLAFAHQYILSLLRKDIQLDFEQKCYSFFGIDCFAHLAKVTCGLDSACPFETEIQGQVKCAYEQAAKTQVLSPALHFLFQKCLQVGKEIRTKLSCHSQVSLEHILWSLAKEKLQKNLAPLFIGASEINAKIARFLHQKGIRSMTFCNRTQSKAEQLAEQFQGTTLAWDELPCRWIEYDWILSAVKSATPIVLQAPSIRPAVKKLLIDLAVPRNISPSIADDNYELYNIDSINALLQTQKCDLEKTVKIAENALARSCTRKLAAFHAKRAHLEAEERSIFLSGF